MTFSADELWAGNNQGLCYTINLSIFYLYVALFITVILLANIVDYRKICERKVVLISCSLVSVVFDLGILSISEFLILLTIDQIARDLLTSSVCILLIALPWCLGEITMSSLTIRYLKQRVEKLHKEISKLRKEAENLEKQTKRGKKKLEELEKRRREFQKAFNKNRGSDDRK